MVKINRFPVQTVEVFTPDGESLGFVNEIEFNDIKLQIAEQNLEGYYIMFEDKKINININGEIMGQWPVGLFDIQLRQFRDLINARKAKTDKN